MYRLPLDACNSVQPATNDDDICKLLRHRASRIRHSRQKKENPNYSHTRVNSFERINNGVAANILLTQISIPIPIPPNLTLLTLYNNFTQPSNGISISQQHRQRRTQVRTCHSVSHSNTGLLNLIKTCTARLPDNTTQ